MDGRRKKLHWKRIDDRYSFSQARITLRGTYMCQGGYLHNHCSINEPIAFPSSMGTGVWIMDGRRKKLHWKRIDDRYSFSQARITLRGTYMCQGGYLHNHCSINEPIAFPSSMGTGVWIMDGRRKKLHWKRIDDRYSFSQARIALRGTDMYQGGYLHNHYSINEPITFPSSMGTGVWIMDGRRKKLHWKRID